MRTPGRAALLAAALALLAAPGRAQTHGEAGGILWIPKIWSVESINTWRDYWSSNIAVRVEYMDHFFGDPRMKEDNDLTRVTVGLGTRYEKEGGLSLESKFDARLALPRIENRLQLIVDNTFDVEDPEGIKNIRREVRDPEPEAGLRYIFFRRGKWRGQVDGGVDFSSPVQAYVRPRGSFAYSWNLWDLKLAEAVKLASAEGLSSASSMTWSRRLGGTSLLRSSSQVDWAADESGVSPSEVLSYLRSISPTRAHRFSLIGRWPNVPEVDRASYAVEYAYRRLIHRDWVFVEIRPGVDFSQARDYEANPYISVVFDLVFEDTRRRDAGGPAAP